MPSNLRTKSLYVKSTQLSLTVNNASVPVFDDNGVVRGGLSRNYNGFFSLATTESSLGISDNRTPVIFDFTSNSYPDPSNSSSQVSGAVELKKGGDAKNNDSYLYMLFGTGIGDCIGISIIKDYDI